MHFVTVTELHCYACHHSEYQYELYPHNYCANSYPILLNGSEFLNEEYSDIPHRANTMLLDNATVLAQLVSVLEPRILT
jgi:hypothetical protein